MSDRAEGAADAFETDAFRKNIDPAVCLRNKIEACKGRDSQVRSAGGAGNSHLDESARIDLFVLPSYDDITVSSNCTPVVLVPDCHAWRNDLSRRAPYITFMCTHGLRSSHLFMLIRRQ